MTAPSPDPADIPTEPWEATPGVEGFLLGFFFLGIALAFLMWSMNRHLRRIKHNAKIEQQRIDQARADKAAEQERAREAREQEAEESRSLAQPLGDDEPGDKPST